MGIDWGLNFGLSLRLLLYFAYASNKGSGETVHLSLFYFVRIYFVETEMSLVGGRVVCSLLKLSER